MTQKQLNGIYETIIELVEFMDANAGEDESGIVSKLQNRASASFRVLHNERDKLMHKAARQRAVRRYRKS